MEQNPDESAGSGAGRLSDRALSIAWIAVFLAWLVGFAAVSSIVSDWMLFLILLASILVGVGVLHLFPTSTRSRLSSQLVPAFLLWFRFCIYVFVPGAAYTVVRWVSGSRTAIRLP